MKKELILPIILIIISIILLGLAKTYYDFSNQIKNYEYCENTEYKNVSEGLNFLKTLPIEFNILNKYFSNMNNLSQEEKEQIIISYAIKNKYKLYNCGPSNGITSYLCINKDDLKDKNLLKKFNLKLNFVNNDISIYVDDYGKYTINSNSNSTYYKIVLDENENTNYRIYSSFKKYNVDGDIYKFYMYQGYYKANCIKGEKLKLYDFMSGKVIYTDTCNGNNNFTIDPSDKKENLQLYKYELKKDKNNDFYLYGYNPVKSKIQKN